MKKAFPFPTSDLPPFLQCYAVTMESGAVILARVMAADTKAGIAAARDLAAWAAPCAIWDSAAFPCGPDMRAKGPGYDLLRGAGA